MTNNIRGNYLSWIFYYITMLENIELKLGWAECSGAHTARVA